MCEKCFSGRWLAASDVRLRVDRRWLATPAELSFDGRWLAASVELSFDGRWLAASDAWAPSRIGVGVIVAQKRSTPFLAEKSGSGASSDYGGLVRLFSCPLENSNEALNQNGTVRLT
jgi:hypothetical protein